MGSWTAPGHSSYHELMSQDLVLHTTPWHSKHSGLLYFLQINTHMIPGWPFIQANRPNRPTIPCHLQCSRHLEDIYLASKMPLHEVPSLNLSHRCISALGSRPYLIVVCTKNKSLYLHAMLPYHTTQYTRYCSI